MAFRAGVTLTDFWDSTPREVGYQIEAYSKRQHDENLEAWRRTRWQTAALMNMLVAKGKQIKVTDLIRLPGDDINMTSEAIDVEAMDKKFDEMDAARKAKGLPSLDKVIRDLSIKV